MRSPGTDGADALSVGPGDEVFHVRTVFVSAVVLAPGEFAVEQAGVHGRHFRGAIIFLFADVVRAPRRRKTGPAATVAM